MTSIKYYINEEKKTVVAKAENLYGLAFEVVREVMKKYKWIDEYNFAAELLRKFKVPMELTAKARCSDLDIYDEDHGMELSRARLLLKIYWWKIRLMDYVKEELYGGYEFAEDCSGMLDAKLDTLTNYIEKLEV